MDVKHVIYWMEHDQSLNADKRKIGSLKNQLQDTENQIHKIQNPVKRKLHNWQSISTYFQTS